MGHALRITSDEQAGQGFSTWHNDVPAWVKTHEGVLRPPKGRKIAAITLQTFLQHVADAGDKRPDGSIVNVWGHEQLRRRCFRSRSQWWAYVEYAHEIGVLVTLARGGVLGAGQDTNRKTNVANTYGMPGQPGALDSARARRRVQRMVAESRPGGTVLVPEVIEPGEQAQLWRDPAKGGPSPAVGRAGLVSRPACSIGPGATDYRTAPAPAKTTVSAPAVRSVGETCPKSNGVGQNSHTPAEGSGAAVPNPPESNRIRGLNPCQTTPEGMVPAKHDAGGGSPLSGLPASAQRTPLYPCPQRSKTYRDFKSKRRRGKLPRLTVADLRNTQRLADLAPTYARAWPLHFSQQADVLLSVVTMAEHALAKDRKHAPALFVSNLANGRWHVMGDRAEQAAIARLSSWRRSKAAADAQPLGSAEPAAATLGAKRAALSPDAKLLRVADRLKAQGRLPVTPHQALIGQGIPAERIRAARAELDASIAGLASQR